MGDLFDMSNPRYPPKGGFDGHTYEPKKDKVRLTKQIGRVFKLMRDGKWRTVQEIAAITEDPENSVSAQLRNLRKGRFGGHKVERRIRGYRAQALYEYRLEVKE